MNLNIGNIKDLHLSVIYQNGGFTKVWLAMKTVFFPCIICIMVWFWHRVHLLQRSPVLIEYMLLYLGGALTILNSETSWKCKNTGSIKILLSLVLSADRVSDADIWYAVYVAVKWHSTRRVLCDALLVLAGILRRTYAGEFNHLTMSIHTLTVLINYCLFSITSILAIRLNLTLFLSYSISNYKDSRLGWS